MFVAFRLLVSEFTSSSEWSKHWNGKENFQLISCVGYAYFYLSKKKKKKTMIYKAWSRFLSCVLTTADSYAFTFLCRGWITCWFQHVYQAGKLFLDGQSKGLKIRWNFVLYFLFVPESFESFILFDFWDVYVFIFIFNVWGF